MVVVVDTLQDASKGHVSRQPMFCTLWSPAASNKAGKRTPPRSNEREDATMAHYIGLDAHSGTCVFVTIDEIGKVVSKMRVPTTEGFLLRYVRSLKGRKKLVVEESHISQWCYLTLKDEVDELIVCNPVYLGRKQGAKDDFRDGLHLANELRCGHLIPVHHEDTELWTLRTLVQAYLDTTKELVQAKNRYKSIFRAQAIEVSGDAVYSDKSFLEKLHGVDHFVATNMFTHIEHLNASKKSYLPEFQRYRLKHPEIKRLCSVPGISLIRATIITSLVCSPHRFANKHKFWAYCMLVKYIDKSDGMTYGSRAIHGRRELKSVFDGAALAVLQGDSALREYYDRLRTKQIPHKSAKKAVARRVAAICLSLLKGSDKYDDLYEVKRERSKRITV